MMKDPASLKEAGRASVAGWYAEKARSFGFGPQGLGWNSRAGQVTRFKALCQVGDLAGKSVLDVGCGFGDLLAFLRERGEAPIYRGLDVCPEMIKRCRARFGDGGEGSLIFEVADVMDLAPAEPADYVLASGVFGLLSRGFEERLAPMLARLFSFSSTALAVNFLSARAKTRAEGRFWAEPERMLAMALELTPAASLRHDYLPNDFTLYLYKNPAWRAP